MAPHPAPGGVLALDLGSTVGWAYGHIEQQRAASGRWRLRFEGEGEGDRYRRLSNETYETLERLQPSRLIVEAPLVLAASASAGHQSDRSVNQQRGLRAIVWCEASRMGMRPQEFSADLVRYELLGRSRFKKGTIKQIIVAWAKDQGYRPVDHNEADAIALWTYWADAQRRGLGINPAVLVGADADG